MTASNPPSVRSLIFWPVVISLAIVTLRLVLELNGAPGWLASDAEGGGSAVLGIAWLPLILGPYFAFQLAPSCATKGELFKRLFRTMLAYGLAVRIPVILLSIVLIYLDLGTHFEKIPADVGMMGKVGLTVLAQLVAWALVWTALIGSLIGWLFAMRGIRPGVSGNVSAAS